MQSVQHYFTLPLHGFRVEYYSNSKQVHVHAETVNGMLHGAYHEYHKNGTPKYEGTFLYNRPIGQCKTFYDDGQLEASMTFNGYGNLEGLHWTYYPHGQLMCKAYFVNGEFHGYYSVYDEDGTLLMLRIYEYGTKKQSILEPKE